jgi:hypothetical protein
MHHSDSDARGTSEWGDRGLFVLYDQPVELNSFHSALFDHSVLAAPVIKKQPWQLGQADMRFAGRDVGALLLC